MFLLLDRFKEKFLRLYYKQLCIKKTKCKSRNITVLGKIVHNATNVTLGNNVTLYPNVMFWGDGEIIIGDNVDIGKDTIIFSHEKVVIGNNTSIAAQCYIIDSNHGIERRELIRKQPLNSKEINIGEDVWIAAGCKIIKGAEIKNGAIIGAMSLVNSLIDENIVAAGIPARCIKERI